MRALIATLLLVFGGVVCAVDAVGIYAHGSIPKFTAQRVDGVESVVVNVSPEAAAQGLHVGDRYRLSENWPLQRATHGYSTRGAVPPDTEVPVSIGRGGQTMVIHLRSAAATTGQRLAMWLDVAFKFLGTLIGAVLVVRGRDAFGLYAGIGIAGMSLSSGFISGLYLGSFTLTEIVDATIVTIGLWARYFLVEAMLAICGLRRGEAAIIRGYGDCRVGLLDGRDLFFNVRGHHRESRCRLLLSKPLAGALLLPGAVVAARGPARVSHRVAASARRRSRSDCLDLCRYVRRTQRPHGNLILRTMGDTVPLAGALNLTLVLLAAGYAYVALRYRIVNISFVLNRAVVYAALGSLVLAVFVVVEFVATRFAVGQTNSAVIEMLVALALGFTIKQLEQRVDAVVERVLFAPKHRAEEALRELIRDCGHVEHLPALFARACTESRRILSADRVTIYETRDEGYAPAYSSPEGLLVPPADVDDGAFVRLRWRRESLDLHEMGSAVGSEGLLFPMLVRGRLLGAIYFGPKAKRAAYDPDERKLLLDLSHEVGASSLVLSLSEAVLR